MGQAWSRNMISHERGLPEVFDPRTGQNIKWRTTPGTGTHATPVVAGGRVYLGTNNNRPRDARHSGDRGVLMCLTNPPANFCGNWSCPNSPTAFIGTGRTRAFARRPRWRVSGFISSAIAAKCCVWTRGMTNGNDGPFPGGGALRPAGASPMARPHSADILWRFDMIQEFQVRQHDSRTPPCSFTAISCT